MKVSLPGEGMGSPVGPAQLFNLKASCVKVSAMQFPFKLL